MDVASKFLMQEGGRAADAAPDVQHFRFLREAAPGGHLFRQIVRGDAEAFAGLLEIAGVKIFPEDDVPDIRNKVVMAGVELGCFRIKFYMILHKISFRG